MQSLPIMPKRNWLERASLGLAAALTAIGMLTVLGWWLRVDELLQPVADFGALKINSAVGFLSLGLALLAIEWGWHKWTPVAGAALLIGVLTLVQDWSGVDLRIDQLLAGDHLLTDTEHPGRGSGLAAVCLVLGSLALLCRRSPWPPRTLRFGEAVGGSIITSAGLTTLLGYGAGLRVVYTWGTETATSPVAALALLLLGVALVLLGWRDSTKAEHDVPTWAPLPLVIICLSLTAVLWIGLRVRERESVGATTQSQMDQLVVQTREAMDRQATAMDRIARSWAKLPDNDPEAWEADAVKLLSDGARDLGCLWVAYVNSSLHTKWVNSRRENEVILALDHAAVEERRIALLRAAASSGPILSATTNVVVPGRGLAKGFTIYAPVIRADEVADYVAAEFRYPAFFQGVASAVSSAKGKLLDDYTIIVSVGREIVFSSHKPDAVHNDKLTFDRAYTIADRRIRFVLTPAGRLIAHNHTYLPELAFAAGIGFTMLLGLTVQLARSAYSGQRAAELSNKRLFAENEERRRIEARLKISDERLRLALDSTQIGIFEWSVPAGHVYYSPGLWAMLGYDHAHMPSTVEAWQTLIHSDDLPLYRRRTDSQLNGVASFIEPEYRVRARSGDWRWVYTRSKSVASNADGRPTRIIGTVQDITARREAEFALRESQAEARKLSLVAAKTDSPVLIGSPDGRIEWANEAFCRVMEYSLDEVVGKNPVHFMLGPDTNPRTVARIRAAMSRGQGISTDVVNYSKSGRRYHLHIEIQPVRGATGELENFIAVETDVTARVDTEVQLRRAKAEADAASRAKSEFLASMSHEIRTPMNGVIGMTSLLMETSLTSEQRDYVNTIRNSGEALLTIINDILDFSKIESGKMELERAPFDLTLCLEDALDLFALQASAKKLELGYYMAPEVPSWVVGDVTRLRQILVNLINNAVKFTPTGSISIEVRRVTRDPTPIGFDPGLVLDSARPVLEFIVRDTGIGIPADRIGRLFKAFSQVDSSTTRKYGGTGLGLAICQRLCDLMGGGIRVESREGEGSSFIFTIQTEPAAFGVDPPWLPAPDTLRMGSVLCIEGHPVTQARLRSIFERWGVACKVVPDITAALEMASVRPPALLVMNAVESEDPANFHALSSIRCPRVVLHTFGQTPTPPLDDSHPTASTTKPIRTTPFLHAIVAIFHTVGEGAAASQRLIERPIGEQIPLEVLLAEDNAVNQKVALRFLERLGYHADAVANGLEAVAAVENRRYDLVLMDLQMPEMDGFQATQEIRRRFPSERQPKIIALTANAMKTDREQCEAAGMDDYLSKPVKMHEIAAVIRRHFAKPAEVPVADKLIG
jgi:PAS domain S-box-containing protein